MSKVSIVDAQTDEAEPLGIERRRFDRTDLLVRIEYSTIDEIFSEFTRDINECYLGSVLGLRVSDVLFGTLPVNSSRT